MTLDSLSPSESEPSEFKAQVESVLDEFSRSDQEMICFLFGLKGRESHSSDETMQRFNVTNERIRQVRYFLLEKIQRRR